MKKQIVHVSLFQSAKVAAALYLVLSLPFVAIFMIAAMFVPSEAGMGMGIGMMLVLPLLYALFGFIFTLIAAWIYNLVASQVGGFEFTTTEVDGR